MNTKKLLLKLSKRFPKRIAKANHDFVGLMVGSLKEDTKRILLCLDFDETILDKAISFKPDLILTHHPFIYGRKSLVLKSDPLKKKLYDTLIELDIPVYSMHTNFDTGKGGMNDALASKLGLINVYAPLKDPMMRIGELEKEMNVYDFAHFAKEQLGVPNGSLIDAGKKTIKKVGIIGGGGSYLWRIAEEEGADIYVSGDVRHHTRREIVLNKYNYLDLPHEIENIFMPTMETILKSFDKDLEILKVTHEVPPMII